ncbi:hypothetical protein P5V15_008280 [Pogonomyrmex californicus]
MDFYFDFLTIFLILGVASIGNSKNSKVYLSENIAVNPFLQSSPTRPNVEIISFVPSSPNKNGNPFLSNSATNNKNPSPNSVTNSRNPFLSNTVIKPDKENSYFSNIATSGGNPFLSNSVTNNQKSSFSSSDTSGGNPFLPSVTNNQKPPSPSSGTSGGNLFLPSVTNNQKPLSPSKCDEYAGEISGVTEIQSLTGSSSGVFRVNNACQDSNHLVIGGVDAQPGEFPHMAALGRLFGQTFSYMCGGTLISHTWVLSAAHCTYGPNGDPTNVRIGFYELTDQAGIMIAISDMIRHPEYLPPELYADIALILLESPVTFSLAIRPACLYQRYDFVPKNAWVSGWGATEFAGDASNRLQKAQLTLISNVKCSEKHNTSIEVPHGISTNMICAGDVRGNRSSDTCEGDSGGPLQIIHPQNDCLFQVIGITSFGQACGIGDTPGVYTKVSPYLSWIESYVWPEGQ